MGQFHLQQLHNSLVNSAKRFHLAEADLLEHIQRAEKYQLHLYRGHNSMFVYVTQEIGLSSANAYSFIAVARKSKEVPELKKAIENGSIGVSKANKIVSVLTPQNKEQWITKAKTLTSRELEEEIVESNPELKPKGYTKKLSKEITRVALDLSPEDIELLNHAKDLLSSNKSGAVSNEEAFRLAFGELVEKYDPVEKAKRAKEAKTKKEKSASQQLAKPKSQNTESSNKSTSLFPGRVKLSCGDVDSRERIIAATKHALNLREDGRCAFIGENGQRCGCTRHLHIHHIKPVSQGGGNELDNLTLLCARHHRLVHENLFRQLTISESSDSKNCCDKNQEKGHGWAH